MVNGQWSMGMPIGQWSMVNGQWSCARRAAARAWVVGNENHLIKNLKFYKSGVGFMWVCVCAMLQ